MRNGRIRKIVRASVAVGAAVGTVSSPACLDRPVTPISPQTSNIFVSVIRQTAIDKIDLLFVVDNSMSMADKQIMLADAVPELVNRLIAPAPVDGKLPFKPVRDIHIGVISSSLGGHGADQCIPTAENATVDDKAHLIGTLQSSSPERAAAPAGYQNLGFLAWDPDNKYGGESDRDALIKNFREQVEAVGEHGCGYEATLEAWYRFLIDPNPASEIVVENGQAVARGTDEALLAQRSAFLRPDSLVAIIMLTDENDCSITDSGIGWMSAQRDARPGVAFTLPRSTSACATDPNSPCCQSCGTLAPNSDCAALPALDAIKSDPECQKGLYDTKSDNVNLRCFEQKRRFGIDFLYPTSRYVDALKSLKVRDRDGVEHDNPLFVTPGALPRNMDHVFLAGIVGVPWQDVATPATLDATGTLEYQRAGDIRWDWIVGDLMSHTKPLDPLMQEQPEPRSGVNPAKGYPIAPATSLDPRENLINGHEYTTSQADLQYACIFPLESSRDCTIPGTTCDCSTSDLDANKPLCQPLTGGPAETNQYFAKAYPGLRHLQVLEDFGKNSIVASICPKVVDKTNPSYGYNPAVSAIADMLGEALPGECLPRKLVPEDDPTSPDYEKVPCEVVEARPANGEACTCDAARGTSELTSSDATLVDAVKKKLAELGTCGGSTGIACSDFCLCSINQLTGAALDACQAGTPTDPGYCYIDQEIAERNGNDKILADCEETKKQILSFVGDNVPAKGSIAFIACSGATFGGS